MPGWIGRWVALTVLVAAGTAGAFFWDGRAAATSPCRPWLPVALTATRLEVVRADGTPVPASDPVVETTPAALCLEPTDQRGSAVKVKDCYEPELSGTFVMEGAQP